MFRRSSIGTTLAFWIVSGALNGAEPDGPTQHRPVPDRQHAVPQESQGENTRSSVAPNLLNVIDTAASHCYQPDPARNQCYITWLYHQVSSSTAMKYLRISINGRVVSNTQGFFQNNLYLPQPLNGPGFRVPCGRLGSGGDPALGSAYEFNVAAEDIDGNTGNNTGRILCPAYLRP